jgi:hypothetical protein
VSENTVAEIVKDALAMARNAPNQATQRPRPGTRVAASWTN